MKSKRIRPGDEMRFAKEATESKRLRRAAGAWLKKIRSEAGLSQLELAQKLGLKYYTFISQVENGFGRVPTESMEAWGLALGIEPAAFAKRLLSYYDPELYRLLFGVKR
jgi:transcriptional regulator with XRE-family HTH domain